MVYRAWDARLQRAVALKVLPTALTKDPERRKRLFQEARAAARISHPAIAQVYDVDESDGVVFIAMELVEGKTVQELIERRELDLLGTIDIAIQVADGLAKAHETGVIHRDIKPANVMLTPDGRAKILDFGLAKAVDTSSQPPSPGPSLADLSTITHTLAGTVMGTAAYMSPEQVKCLPLSPRSDLFSLGVMLFEMAAGESPFRRPSLVETMHAVSFEDAPPVQSIRPNLPPDLQRILSRCLRKRPEDRYPSATALAEDLRLLRRDTESGALRAVPIRDWLAGAFGRVTRLRPKEYVWLAAGLTVLAVIAYVLSNGVKVAGIGVYVVMGLLAFRRVRNRPHRLRETFVRKVSRIPEVRAIVIRGPEIIVVVDRPASQLYGRISRHVDAWNRSLFLGRQVAAAIHHDLESVEFQRLLKAPGVQYLRDDAGTKPAIVAASTINDPLLPACGTEPNPQPTTDTPPAGPTPTTRAPDVPPDRSG